MNAGDTLLVAEPGTSYDSHLWIIISDPGVDADRVVIVNMTSHRDDKDQACVLDQGDHPYVSHKTCINYPDAKTVRLDHLEALIKVGKIRQHIPCSNDLLTKIRNGIPDSRMRLGVVQILVEQGVIEEP